MTGADHAAWADSAGAYLLGALDDAERAGYEAHLAGCAECRAEVDRLRVASDALGASPVQVLPPAPLKGRIMGIVNSEAELLRAAGPSADRAGAEARPRRRWAWLSMRPGLALAGATAVLVLGAVAGLLGGTALRGEDPARTVAAEVTAPGAQARLIVRDEHSTLVTRRMPPPGEGRVYQVWLKRPGQAPQPTDALFDVRPDGSASVDVPGSLEGVEAVLVTSEPDGGSQVPSRAPVIAASPA